MSEKDRRFGDVVLEFDERDPQLGDRVVTEVQHKHEDKDIQAATADLVAQDFAVVWLNEWDFGPSRCRLDEVDLRARAQKEVWPDYIPEVNDWQRKDEMVARDVAG